MSAEKRKKKPRGRPPENNHIPLPASFEEIMQSVVRTRTPEEIAEMLEEEKNDRKGAQQADTEF